MLTHPLTHREFDIGAARLNRSQTTIVDGKTSIDERYAYNTPSASSSPNSMMSGISAKYSTPSPQTGEHAPSERATSSSNSDKQG